MSSDDISQKVNTARESLLSLGARVSGVVIGFVTLTILARHLGPSGLGRYAFLFAVGLIASVLSGGVGTAIKKRISESESNPNKILGLGLILHLIASIGILGAVLATAKILPRLSTAGALAISTIAFGRGLKETAMAVKSGLGSPGASYWYDTGQTLLTASIQIPMAYLGFSATSMLGGYAFASVSIAVVLLISIPVSVERPTLNVSRSVAEFAKWSIPNSAITALYNRCEEAWFGVLGGATVVGYLNTATRVATPGTMVSWSLSNALVVRISQRHSSGEDVFSDIETGLRYAGIASTPVFFGSLSISKNLLVVVFGSKFSEASSFLVIIALVYAIRSYTIQFTAYLNALDAPHRRFRGQLIAVVLKVSLLPVLLVTYSERAALMIFIFSEIVLVGLYGYHIQDIVGRIPFPRAIPQQVLCSLVMVLALEATPKLLSGVPHIVVRVCLGGGLYVILLLSMSRPLRERVQEVIPVLTQSGFTNSQR